ncbi:putative DNA binding protein [Mycobacteroides abscessus M93]|nr:putative DNA binding protein [Mycobacteroides abscessus M93]
MELGPTGELVAANVKRLRDGREYKWLSEQLKALGRDITPLAVRRIEERERRVDADDLVALAVALGVSPMTLLAPPFEDPKESVRLLDDEVNAVALWEWLRVNRPLAGQSPHDFLVRSSPPWVVRRMMELLQEQEMVPDPRVRAMLRGDGSGNDK